MGQVIITEYRSAKLRNETAKKSFQNMASKLPHAKVTIFDWIKLWRPIYQCPIEPLIGWLVESSILHDIDKGRENRG